MKHVLHLASWYPNRRGPQEGDFIQRQLQALAAYTPVHVLAVIKDDSLKPGSTSIEKNDEGCNQVFKAFFCPKCQGGPYNT